MKKKRRRSTHERERIVLAALAPADGKGHSPVQVQKLMFLLDREASDLVGQHFDFIPYHYGPFDSDIYRTLESLDAEGLVTIRHEGNHRSFALTPAGQRRGEEILHDLPPRAQDYTRRLSEFVRKLSFTQLVSAVYKAYPEMRQNSVMR